MNNSLSLNYLKTTYTLAKREFEIASTCLSDACRYIPFDLYNDVYKAQAILEELAQVMQDLINNIENSGQPEKNKEEKENG